MGICYSEDKSKSRRQVSEKTGSRLAKADPNASQALDIKDIDAKIRTLKSGNLKEIEAMIDQSNDDINSYCFGSNKTLLLEAVMDCPNPKVVDLIMKKGAIINYKEKETGNTAIFLCAIDLKVDFVRTLLNYNPDLTVKNNADQTIFEFMQFQLYDQRKSLKREMTRDEKENYDAIMSLLKEHAGINERLDIDSLQKKSKKSSDDDSDEFR